MTEEQRFEHVMDLVPEGHTVIHALRIVESMDENGGWHYHTAFEGDSQKSLVIGLIEMVKHDALTLWEEHFSGDD